MRDWRPTLRKALSEHLSSMIVDVIVQRLSEKIALAAGQQSIDAIVTEVAQWIRLYLRPDNATECLNNLRNVLEADQPEVSTATFVSEVLKDRDIIQVRQQASAFVFEAIADNMLSIRVSTVVSELARNMVQYAGGGLIQVKLLGNGAQIRAVDRGPGIPHLDQVLQGTFRSKTGLGIGLQGIKRVASRFDIQTQSGIGTTVVVLLQAA